MGYVVIVGTVVLLLIFLLKKWRQRTMFKSPQSYQGYFLLVKKYEEQGSYYGVFQQGTIEVTLEMSPDIYIRVIELTRGYLTASSQRVIEFSE